eukprot:CAMPEP_0175611302 /NCGR_PEP_ID=MMETSP0096-20121207/63230_1 /TAXON_ID=311494 /ORGANISM="Alexandrium monilatum, Strain CCMP3105" /LENGTH=272 /DNA_ID=CAMNT_0016916297 /DNA_START=1 /DNA_END=820 /DNA_ORIENTATION=+
MAQEAPAHAWVVLLDGRSLWSPRFMSVVHPALRKAAADSRIVAVSCPRHAQAKEAMDLPEDPSKVDAAVNSGEAIICDEVAEELQFAQLLVRVKAFRGFFESTPAAVLPHPLCAHRFHHRLHHTFGKKVHVLAAPEGEWLCWRSAPTATGTEVDDVEEPGAGRSSRACGPRPPLPASEEAVPPAAGRLADAEDAARAAARLRRAVERRFVRHAGETLAPKDARAMAMEQMTEFLEEMELDQVVGIQRWAKQTCAELSEAAAQQFAVEIADGK